MRWPITVVAVIWPPVSPNTPLLSIRQVMRSPRAAVVVAIEVEAGQPVGPGDPLVRLGAAPG